MRASVSHYSQTEEINNFNASTFSAKTQMVRNYKLSQISPTAKHAHPIPVSHHTAASLHVTEVQRLCLSPSLQPCLPGFVNYRARKRFPQGPAARDMIHIEVPHYPLLFLRKEVSLFPSHIGLNSGKQKFERSECRIR